MTERERLEREVEKTLQCFDEIETIEPRPFFFTRLKARITSLEQEKAAIKQPGWSFGPLRPALLSLLIILNVLSALAFFQENATSTGNRNDYLNAFAEEYAFTQEEEDLFSIVN